MSDLKQCPRCACPLDVPEPQVGEIWLRVDTRKLYAVVDRYKNAAGNYAMVERLHPRGVQGCDPEGLCAMWPNAVGSGEWIKVEGMRDE